MGSLGYTAHMETKTCSKCGTTYPATPEFFVRSKIHKDGLYPSCKKCTRAQYREHYERNREKIIARTTQYHQDNPDAQKRASAKWKQEHREQHLQETRDRSAAWRELNRDKDRTASKRWREDNPDAYRAIQHAARARKRNSQGSFSAEQWERLKDQFGYRCPRCGRAEPEITLTVDHVVPLAWGGSNDIGNIQPLCKACNAAKGAREAADYRSESPDQIPTQLPLHLE